MSPKRDARDAGQARAAAAHPTVRWFGALAWLCAWSGMWWALLPPAATCCPNTPDGSPCRACPACLPEPSR